MPAVPVDQRPGVRQQGAVLGIESGPGVRKLAEFGPAGQVHAQRFLLAAEVHREVRVGPGGAEQHHRVRPGVGQLVRSEQQGHGRTRRTDHAVGAPDGHQAGVGIMAPAFEPLAVEAAQVGAMEAQAGKEVPGGSSKVVHARAGR